MDEPAFPGRVLTCRPIGVIEGEQGKKNNKERNASIIAVEQDTHSWADIKTIDDLSKQSAGSWKNSSSTTTSLWVRNIGCWA